MGGSFCKFIKPEYIFRSVRFQMTGGVLTVTCKKRSRGDEFLVLCVACVCVWWCLIKSTNQIYCTELLTGALPVKMLKMLNISSSCLFLLLMLFETSDKQGFSGILGKYYHKNLENHSSFTMLDFPFSFLFSPFHFFFAFSLRNDHKVA